MYPRRCVRDAAQIFLVIAALGCLTSRGLTHGDAALHLATADAWLAGRGALELDVGESWVPSERVAGGLFYDDGNGLRSASDPGMAALAVPAAALGGPPLGEVLAPLFGEGPPASLRALQHDRRVILFAWLAPLFAGLAAAFVAWGASRRAAFALALGSPLVAYAGTDWTQLPVTAAFAFAFAWLARRRSGLPIGVALALAGLVRSDALLLALPVAFAARGRRAKLEALAPLVLAGGALALRGLPAPGDGWSFVHMPAGLPLLAVSLLAFAPWVLALPWTTARGRLPAAALAVSLIAVVFYGGWFDHGADLAFGPRFLLPALPGLAIALGRPTARAAPLVDTLALGGLLVSLPGVLIAHVRLPDGPFAAWRVLLDELPRVDGVSGSVPAYALLALALALIGVVREARGLRGA